MPRLREVAAFHLFVARQWWQGQLRAETLAVWFVAMQKHALWGCTLVGRAFSVPFSPLGWQSLHQALLPFLQQPMHLQDLMLEQFSVRVVSPVQAYLSNVAQHQVRRAVGWSGLVWQALS